MRYHTLRTARSLGLNQEDLAAAAYERYKKSGDVGAAVVFINDRDLSANEASDAETFLFSNMEARGILRRVCGAHAKNALLRLTELIEEADPERHVVIAVLRPYTEPLVGLLTPDLPPPAAYARRQHAPMMAH